MTGRPASLARRAVLVGPLALMACGFAPALAPGPQAPALTGITVADPNNRLQFVYHLAMEDLIAAPGDRVLTYRIRISQEAVLRSTAQATERAQITGVVAWTLRGADGGRIADGRETAFTSWSGSGTEVSERASQRDAQDRLMRILAERTAARLVAAAP